MKINFEQKIKSHAGILLVPVFEEYGKKLPSAFPISAADFFQVRFKNKEFKATFGETIATYQFDKNLPEKLVLIGLGKKDKFLARHARRLGGKVGRHIKCLKPKALTVAFVPELEKFTEEFVEGLLMSLYTFDTFKKKKEKPYQLETIYLVGQNQKSVRIQAQKAQTVIDGINYVRDLVNLPSNLVDAEYLAAEARKIARENKYKLTIFDKKKLTKMGWGGLLAVNQGHHKEPRAIILEYNGALSKKEKPIVLVGKGILFDTGGYNLKPTGSIETMHQDMAGSAVVLGLFSILKKLNIRRNVVAVIAAAENMISSRAYKPSDIIKTLSGLTVEVTNTDAEGRIVLADAITYGKKFKPQALITIATLTGAVAIALGNRYAGLIGNDSGLRSTLAGSGREVDDLGWPLPLHSDFKKKMESEIADIRNTDIGTSRYAGSSKGAAFLAKFVGKEKWCHIDIGGTAYTDDPKEYETKGATAHGLRMLLRYLEK